MKRLALGSLKAVAWASVLTLCAVATAQQPAPEEPVMGSGKRLPPGLLVTIPPDPQPAETYSGPRPFVELLNDPKLPDWTPNFSPKNYTLKSLAEHVTFRRTIWNLEFSFKPLRMIDVDIPQPTGKMQRKTLWYMVYKVRNNGYHYGVKTDTDKWKHPIYGVEEVNQNIFFFPQFVMRANVRKPDTRGTSPENYEAKEYLDRLVPAAMQPIANRERVGVKLHDSVSISRIAIPVSDAANDRSVWGVMIWEDIDPRVNFLSIFAQGLTNAYEFDDPAGAFKAGDPPGTGRIFTHKNLQLNFWRPGDTVATHEGEIRLGMPIESDPIRQGEIFTIYGMTAPLDHQWVYR